MNAKYINFYNNLINLTRNKSLYIDFNKQDTFSDRLIIFLFHFAFFLYKFKSETEKKRLQDLFDDVFHQIEISIREIGYGDVSINKKMKTYVNTFYSILDEIEKWESLDLDKKNKIINKYLNVNTKSLELAQYFENYINYLKKNTFNSLIKGVIKPNF
tara:strand:- start:802 stop:1275 length:474 start_codon:yes stop_codon:yes gene_type:complete